MDNLIEKITDPVCIVFLLEIIFSQKKIISKSQILCLDKNSMFLKNKLINRYKTILITNNDSIKQCNLNYFINPYAFFKHNETYRRFYYFHRIAYKINGNYGKRGEFSQNKRERKTDKTDKYAVVNKCNKRFAARTQRKIARMHKTLERKQTGRNRKH